MFENLSIYEYGNTVFYKSLLQTYRNSIYENLPKPWHTFPVIHLKLNSLINYKTRQELRDLYYGHLHSLKIEHGIENPHNKLLTLSSYIGILSAKFEGLPVVLLVDEYDTPFHFALRNGDASLINDAKVFLWAFLNDIKSAQDELFFAIIMGHSKLALQDLESSPNNLKDVTYDATLSQAFGLTEQEIKQNMGSYLDEFANSLGTNRTHILNELKYWYDGYRFNKENNAAERVFNPISTIQSLKERQFAKHWTNTGSMDLIVDYFYKPSTERLDQYVKGSTIPEDEAFMKLNGVFNYPTDMAAYMLSFGYLTISDYSKATREVTLKFPNNEIKNALEERIADYSPFRRKFLSQDLEESVWLHDSMAKGNVSEMIRILRHYHFIDMKHPLCDNTNQGEINRRLAKIFKAANLKPIVGVLLNYSSHADEAPRYTEVAKKNTKHKDDHVATVKKESSHQVGDIDFLTTNLAENYAVSVKCQYYRKNSDPAPNHKHAYDAMIQLLSYIEKYPTIFWQAVENPDKFKKLDVDYIHLVGLGFSCRKAGTLTGWIVIPTRNKKVLFRQVKSDSEEAKQKIIQYCEMHPF